MDIWLLRLRSWVAMRLLAQMYLYMYIHIYVCIDAERLDVPMHPLRPVVLPVAPVEHQPRLVLFEAPRRVAQRVVDPPAHRVGQG